MSPVRKAPLGVCLTCGNHFQQRRRGRQREHRCPACMVQWHDACQHEYQSIAHARPRSLATIVPGLTWPELVALELLNQEERRQQHV